MSTCGGPVTYMYDSYLAASLESVSQENPPHTTPLSESIFSQITGAQGTFGVYSNQLGLYFQGLARKGERYTHIAKETF